MKAGKVTKITQLTTSQAAEKLLWLRGEPYSLEHYPMFRGIIDSPARKKLMKSGRQVSKTVTLAADMLTKKVCRPFHTTIYCNASDNQTKSFSTAKLDPFLLYSPLVKKTLINSKNTINNVYNKRFANFAAIRLSYITDTGDRVRGESADELELDEIQDMLIDAIIDVEECLSAAPNPKHLYAGTSKSNNNVIEYYWQQSTKNEWMIKCSACNKYNLPDINNIGKHGIICKNCGKPLNTYEGFWYSTADPNALSSSKIQFDAYHIPQIILPMHCCNELKWATLLNKMETYPDYKFLNEVMGVPSGEGTALITEELLRSICDESLNMEDHRTNQNSGDAVYLIAGIDWGGGGRDGTSRTVITITAVYPELEKYIMIYGKIYSTKNFDAVVKDIASICSTFNVQFVYGDWGGGVNALSQLQNLIPSIRVLPVLYSDIGAPYKWDEVNRRCIVNRTVLIDNYVLDLKNGHMGAVKWTQFEPFAKDILNVYEEITDKGRRFWARYPSKPDDSLHSLIYGWLGGRIACHRLTFYSDRYTGGGYSYDD